MKLRLQPKIGFRTKAINIHTTEKIYTQIKQIAKDNRMNMSDLVNEMLQYGIKNLEVKK
jgi:predicted DNA-binding ribbon-helix-helix protein